MRIFGLQFGGRICRYHVAYIFCAPILSFHHPKRMCWSWFIEVNRYRPESECRHSVLRICHIPGAQARTILDLFWLFSIEFVYQRRTEADRAYDQRRSTFQRWLKT